MAKLRLFAFAISHFTFSIFHYSFFI